MRSLSRLKTTILLIAAGTLVSSCDDPPPETLKIAFSEDAHNQIFYVVRDQKFDLDAGIKLEIYPTTSPAETSRLLRNGVVNFITAHLHNAMGLSESNQLTLIGILGSMQGSRALLTTSNIDTVANLRGGKVGAFRGDNMFLESIFEAAGLTENDVQFVYLPNSESERMLERGEVDAVVALEPQVTRMKRAGFHELHSASEGSARAIYALFGDSEYVEEHPSQIPALIESWKAGVEQTYENPQLASNLLGPRVGLTAEEFKMLLDRFYPSKDLTMDIRDESLFAPEIMAQRFIKASSPDPDGAPPRILLFPHP